MSRATAQTLGLVGLAVLGVAAAAAVLFLDAVALRFAVGDWVGRAGDDYSNYTRDDWEFLGRPRWMLWLAFVAGQMVLWAILVPVLVRAHKRLPGTVFGKDVALTIGPLLLLALVMEVVRYAAPFESPLPGHMAKLSVVTLVGFLVVALAVAGMIRVASQAESIGGSNPSEAAQTYADLRDRLRFFLTAAGLVIGGAILTAGALQSALDGYARQEASPEIVLLYGGFLSLLLTVVYAPAFGSVRGAGEKLLDELAPLPAPDWPEWSAARERREELRSFLELDVGLLDSLKVGFAVLTPLASGLLTLLLPGG